METAMEANQPNENAIQVLVVDDSAVIRGLISRSLGDASDVNVVDTAVNGRDALTKLKEHPEVEVVVLDIEMPEMDGLTALPELLAIMPDVKVLMASTLTQRNADISMQALSLGASDYLPKPTMKERDSLDGFYTDLKLKVRALGQATKLQRGHEVPQQAVEKTKEVIPAVSKLQSNQVPRLVESPSSTIPNAIAIASSTGGPQALSALFKLLKGHFEQVPIFITQHMPPTFTTLLAKNLAKEGERLVKEGEDGELVKAGVTYVAPGDYHMTLRRQGAELYIQLDQNPPVNFCRPAADPMIETLSEMYGDKLLITVLTGMGNDGREAAKKAAGKGATVIAQDEESSVVWGMPGAVAHDHICSLVAPIDELAEFMLQREKK